MSINRVMTSVFRFSLILAVLAAMLAAPWAAHDARAANYYARDEFGTAAYTNNDGSVNWAGNWTEQGDDGNAGAGEFLITGGWLRISDTDNITADEGVYRTVDLSAAAGATLSFEYRNSNNLEPTDAVVVEISTNGGTSYTNLFTSVGVNVPNATRFTANISAYRIASTRIRFRVSNDYSAGEYFEFDNVEVAYTVGGTHTATSVLQTVQTYYVPMPENQVLQVLSAINAAAVNPTYVYVSISVIADGSVIYYDHWEDGFETAVNDPRQATSDVWGDNNPANGMPPGYTTDYLSAGDIIILNNVVDVTGWPPNPAVLKYDGGDKIASTEAIAVTRTSWAGGSGTLHGGSVEMLDTSVWGTRFDIPADDTVPPTTPNYDFEYTGLSVMASQNGTSIYRNGTLVTTTPLNEGQSYLFVDGAVAVGDRITASAPVQANLLTGDIGSNYESSWFTLYPYDLLSSNYYAPVGREGSVTTAVVVQNPGDTAITVNWETTAGAQSALNVAAHSWARAEMPTAGSGARFYTSGARFQAISIINSGGQANDWGYTLIPANQLTQQAMVGWGPGQDPTLPVTENGSPVWVVAVGSGTMYVCADYNGDGQGPRTDNDGYRYDELLTLTNLQRAKVFDSDGNQTGMLLYLCNGSEAGDVNKIAVAWGQDPATATAGSPGLDVGTSVPPLPNFTAIKGAELTDDINGDGKFDVGESFEYRIQINNTGALPIPANTIKVEDIIPQYTTYVPNSTRLDGVLIPDNTAGTAFPLDNGGYTINRVLPIEGQFVVSFEVQIDGSLPDATTIKNDAHVSGLDLEYDPEVEITVDPRGKIGDFIWLDIDGDGVQDPDEPGIPGVTVELSNGTCTVGVNCPTTVTDGAGQYTFANLPNGTYTVIVRATTLPGGLTQTGDPDGCPGAACDNRHTVTLGPGNTNKPYYDADFGYQGNVSIGDFVWYDIDRDGVQDGGAEVGLDGITINLTWAGPDGNLATAADNVAYSTVTANGGQYNFTGLPAGTYRVDLDETTLPANYAMTLTTADPLTFTNVAAGTNVTNADFGAAPGASIGDFVWNDLDNDRVQDTGEGGIGGVRVYIDANGNGAYDAGERYTITDDNGKYLITHLPPATYTVRVDASTVPSGYTLTTANIPLSVTVAAGDTYLTADFGYRTTALSVAKTSSAGGSTTPGSTITYNLLVRNNGAQTQTGIGVTDFLPPGTTYVAQSTVVQGYSTATANYRDEFNARSYGNNNGTSGWNWTGNWQEVGDDGSPTAGNITVYDDGSGSREYVLRFYNPGGGVTRDLRAYRQANLSTCTSAALSFTYRRDDIEEDFLVQASASPTTGYVTVFTVLAGNGVTDPNYTASGNVSLNSYVGAPVYVRFGTQFGGNSADAVFIDDVQIACTYATAVTRDNIPGGTYPDLNNGTPPNLVKLEDSFTLAAGQSMQITFRVTVNDPVALASIDNTASVFSTQQLVAQQDSTTDLLPRSSIGDYVWLDADGDGVQDAGEPGLSGVKVTLTGRDVKGNAVSLTAYTDASGAYSFANLLPSDINGYAVTVDPTTLAARKATIPTYDENGTATPHTTTVVLYAGQDHKTADFGYNQSASAGDRVWLDVDGDGAQDVGEPGLPNVTVRLYQGAVLVATTTTDANGEYLFSGIAPGTYTVDVVDATVPAGLALSPGTADPTAAFTLAPGDAYRDADFGYTNAGAATAIVGDRVWSDVNSDGLLGPGEPGIGGVTVALQSAGPDGVLGTADDVTVATTTTAADGTYLFTGVAPGAYVVNVTDTGGVLTGYTLTGGSDPTAPIVLSAGEVYVNADFGYNAPTRYRISDTVWYDADGDGVRDAGESGIAGVTVNLLDSSGRVIATTLTDSAGAFSFGGLPNGNYTVSVADTASVLATDAPTTAPAQARFKAVTISNADVAGINFGYNQPGAIGDTLFGDNDGDGLQDPGEPGLGGVTVQLWLDADKNGIFDSTLDTLVATQVTGASGHYLFTGLGAATYFASVNNSQAALAGYTPTTVDQETGPNAAGTQIQVALANGASYRDADFGYRNTALADVSGSVWNDLDEDGRDDGAGEPPIAGVTVALVDASGKVVATTTTDASGGYIFRDVPAGSYTVRVTDTAGVLAGYHLTSGLDEIPITVAAADITGVDFGYNRTPKTGVIGDFVWRDANRDGVQNAAETGIANVEVSLYSTGPDRAIGGGDDVLIGTTKTDADGRYLFGGLLPGTYYVDVNAATLPAGLSLTTGSTDPSARINLGAGDIYLNADFGYAAATGSAIGDRVWYDANADGVQDPGEVGISGVQITVTGPSCPTGCVVTTGADGAWLVTGLAAGDYTVAVNTATLPAGYGTTPTNGDASRTLTVEAGRDVLYADFGFRQSVAGTIGTIGDTVFLDADGDGTQDAGEPGIAGVTLRVLDNSGNTLGTTTTDANGNYSFVGLRAGSYRVEVTDNAGMLAGLNLSAGTNPTAVISLSAGQNYVDADFPYAPYGGTIGSLIWHDLNGDGVVSAGEQGLQGVTVNLWLDVNGDGVLTPGIDNLLRGAATDADGHYEFTGLRAGRYLVDVTDTAGVLAGFGKTSGAAGVDNNSQADPYAVTLTSGAPSNYTGDFGYKAGTPYAISGVTFEDKDNSAAYAAGTDRLQNGITLRLYRDLDGDGVLDPGEPLIGTTVSDANGAYIFTDIPNGRYIVAADAADSFLADFHQTTQTATRGVQPVTINNANSTGNDFGFYVPGGAQTTPVTLAYFRVSDAGDGKLYFKWTTSLEVGNLGFQLYAWTPGGPALLTEDLIPSQSVDALAPQDYEYTLAWDGAADAKAYYLADVDIRGKLRMHGPFALNEDYGAQVKPELIDWAAIQAAHAAQAQTKAPVQAYTAGQTVNLQVRTTGLYRVTYEQLKAAGFDWAGANAQYLALTSRGRRVPIAVSCGAVFAPGCYVEFYGEALDTLYTDTNVYTLLVDRAQTLRIAVDGSQINPSAVPPAYYMETTTFGLNRHYDFAAPGSDPWYDTEMLVYRKPVTRTFAANIDAYVAGAAPAMLGVDMWGGTDWPQSPDHHIVVRFNGTVLANELFNGLENHPVLVTLPAGLLHTGANTLQLVQPGDTGVMGEIVTLNNYRITYPRAPIARDGRLTFTAAGRVMRVEGLPTANVVVYRLNALGTPVRISQVRVESTGATYRATFPGTIAGQATYVVSTVEAVRAPAVSAARPAVDIKSGTAQYLVIAHGDFIAGVQPLVAYHQGQGMTTRVVDVADVYAQFGYGIFGPQAIRDYIRYAVTNMGTQYVLLVGGDTYDYRNYLGYGSLSFVPSPYARTDAIVAYAPVDALYADVDGDNAPEVALGRLPVRTNDELSVLIAKTLAYAAKDYGGTGVFAADAADAEVSYKSDSEAFIGQLPAGWNVQRAYMDVSGLAGARATLLNAVNNGVALTSYVGHSDIDIWSFSGLFTTADAAALTNAGRPTVVTQWGCWNTYYVSPYYNTLAHKFLLSGDRGAAAVLGASTLTESSAEEALGLLVMSRLAQPGVSMGAAVRDGKAQLAATNPGLLDVLLGWTLLGDPALVVAP